MTTHKKLENFAAKPVQFHGSLVSQPIIIGGKGVYLKKSMHPVSFNQCAGAKPKFTPASPGLSPLQRLRFSVP